MEKAKASGVSMTPSLRQSAIERAQLRHGGNLSAYVQSLIKLDLEHEPIAPTAEERILEKLAVTYGGYFAPTLVAQLAAAQIDQPKLLHLLLRDLCELAAQQQDLADVHVAPTPYISHVPLAIEARAYPPAPPVRYTQPDRALSLAAEPAPALTASHTAAQAAEERRLASLLAREQKRKDQTPRAPMPVAPAKADAKAS